jgi:hypothetical protein
MTFDAVLADQIRWAGARVSIGHVMATVEDNLFMPLHPATRAEFACGSGDELGLGGRTPKMCSLRSSSALACNVFDAWRGRPLDPLVTALRVTDEFTELAFEQKLPHGIPGIPPNVDVMMFGRDVSPVAIESKFLEPYSSTKFYAELDTKYFDRERWTELGLPKTQTLARSIGRSLQFQALNAGQLVKHLLGYGRCFPTARPIRLRYLWFDTHSSCDNTHRDEIALFTDAVDDEIDFSAITYQDLFRSLSSAPEPASGYREYLAARYFAA